MANRKDTKQRAQDYILGAIANEILQVEDNGVAGEAEVLEEMRAQAKRIMKLFGVESYPGLENVK